MNTRNNPKPERRYTLEERMCLIGIGAAFSAVAVTLPALLAVAVAALLHTLGAHSDASLAIGGMSAVVAIVIACTVYQHTQKDN
ncbi:hypothetical protein H8R18_01180 [Nanchangia anserum]|uniref:Uncharacterized protein n=1 Tax=Nanchangia anserum TaxID=2692125 RepID=A0A8I0G8J5_9ACTO|nr:hypothetical protein [Nanchangia anserum]MBD3689852.1 hypothetical protein [Nanchangia anserum]QOX82017.1 hypothetical protein H8R18_01180 [Nanchangia anserum]